MFEQDQGRIPVPMENVPEFGTVVRIQGRRSVLTADRDGHPMPFLRNNETMVVKFTPHIKGMVEQGWADLVDYLEFPAASQYFPTMDEVFGMIEELATTLPGEAILGARVEGNEVVLVVGPEDGSNPREVRVTLPQLVDMEEQVRRAQDAAEDAQFTLQQIMQLVQDAAQAAADAVTADAEQFAALAGAAAERSLEYAEESKRWHDEIGVIQGPMGPRGPAGPPGGGASDTWQAEEAEVIDLLPYLQPGWTAEVFTAQRVGGWVTIQITTLVSESGTWGYPLTSAGTLDTRLRPLWSVFSNLFSSSANDGARVSVNSGGRVYLDSLVVGSAYSGSIVYALPSGAPVPLVEGPQGEQGDPGPQGVPGPEGPQGEAGKDGASVAYEGMVAAYGDLPADLTEGDQGKGWVVNADGRIYVWDGTAFPAQGDAPLFRGPVGPQGPQGEKGDRGDTGLTGARGATGPKGDTGETGEPGPQGVKGDPGERGLPGATGAQGATGLPGRDGRGLIVRGTVSSPASLPSSAQTGDGYVISSTGEAVQWDGTAWSEPFAWTGPEGAQGERGLRGEQGPQGVEGPAGPEGSMSPAQLAQIFGSSSNTAQPMGELVWSGRSYSPPNNTFLRLKTSSDGRLTVSRNVGNVARTDGNMPRLVAPVSGIYLLIAQQCWAGDGGARACGLGSSSTTGESSMYAWMDIGLGRMATAISVEYLNAGTTLYPWVFTGPSTTGQMSGSARGINSRYGMFFMNAG